jgi:hypothetical protein
MLLVLFSDVQCYGLSLITDRLLMHLRPVLQADVPSTELRAFKAKSSSILHSHNFPAVTPRLVKAVRPVL